MSEKPSGTIANTPDCFRTFVGDRLVETTQG